MSNTSEEYQDSSTNTIRRKRKNINFAELAPQPLNISSTVNEEYTAESIRSINAILNEIIKVQERILSFFGVSEEDPEYLDIENILYDGLIELDKVESDKSDELNQKKKEAILIIQGQLRKLDKKLHENVTTLNGEGEDSSSISTMRIEQIKENTNDPLSKSSIDTLVNLETIEETEESTGVENFSNTELPQQHLNRSLVETRLNRNIDNSLDRNKRVAKYLQEIGQKYHTYRETSNFILESSKNHQHSENTYREYHRKLFNDFNNPLRFRTSSTREFFSTDKIIQDYKKNTGNKNVNETTMKEVLPENIFSGLFKTLREYGNNILGIFLPTVEMGNRLALKRIQVVLLQIRLLLILLILEIPFLTALVFLGFYLYMPDVMHYHI